MTKQIHQFIICERYLQPVKDKKMKSCFEYDLKLWFIFIRGSFCKYTEQLLSSHKQTYPE